MEFTRRGGQHGVAGTPGSLHRSHGDEVAVESSGRLPRYKAETSDIKRQRAQRVILYYCALSARSALPSLLIEKVSASLDSVHWFGFQTRIPAVRANSWNDER